MRLDAARRAQQRSATDGQGRPAPYPTAARSAPAADRGEIGEARALPGPPLATTAPVPTLNVLSEQLVQLLQTNGLAIVATDDAKPAEAQTQTSDAAMVMDVDGGTGADQGV